MTCFDANVLMELIFERRHASTCRQFLDSCSGELAVSSLSVSTIMYYAESHKLNLASIERFLQRFICIPVTDVDVQRAFLIYGGRDFEDALQVSCSVREGVRRFVTLDKGLAKKYVKALTIELLA